MRDEIDGRIWAEHHEEFSNSIDRLIDNVKISFERLHAILFDAPWRRPGLR